MKKSLVVVVSIALLCSCTSRYATNDKKAYLKSQNSSHLVVPPPLVNHDISHFYDLPAQTGNPKVSLAPPLN